jgi:hypothetical protein
MHPVGILFTLIAGVLLLTLPRRWAALPLVASALYMTLGQLVEVGPLHFPVVRIMIVIGFLRAIFRKERISGGLNALDKAMLLWGAVLVIMSVFHSSDTWILRLGIIWTELGSYFLFRVFVSDLEDMQNLFKGTCVLLVPVALAMLVERKTGTNPFAILGGVLEQADYRRGRFRASGPFASAILSGTVGAACMAMAFCCWQNCRKAALAGLFAGASIIFASGASGPVMMLMSILFALAMWKVRGQLKTIRWLSVVLVIMLDVVMQDPVYYLVARIDITGGSTGWHRAALLQSAIEHMHEWWMAGTDYTRHWMPTGIYANENHTDITNHYLQNGVWGGLPLMFLFMRILYIGFKFVGKALRENETEPFERQIWIWLLGCMLFGHVTNLFSISYFDQSIVFLYLVLACISSLPAVKPALAPVMAAEPAADNPSQWQHSDACNPAQPAEQF